MAAVGRLEAAKQPPLPLKEETAYEQCPTVRIQHTFRQGAGANVRQVTRKQDTLFCPDASNKERILRTIDEYVNSCHSDLLNLNDRNRHLKAVEIFGSHLKSRWRSNVAAAIADANRDAQDADFVKNARVFLRKHLPPNAFLIQETHLQNATKPFGMDCYTLADRIDLMNDLSVYLPGSDGSKLFETDTKRKNAFYRLMPPAWQLKFDGTGHDLADDSCTIDQLVTFMEQQRPCQDAMRGHRNTRNRGGRGGSGRGRGRNRDRSGRFQPCPTSRLPGRGSFHSNPCHRSSYQNPHAGRVPFQRGGAGRGRGRGPGRSNYRCATRNAGQNNCVPANDIAGQPRHLRIAGNMLHYEDDVYHYDDAQNQSVSTNQNQSYDNNSDTHANSNDMHHQDSDVAPPAHDDYGASDHCCQEETYAEDDCFGDAHHNEQAEYETYEAADY